MDSKLTITLLFTLTTAFGILDMCCGSDYFIIKHKESGKVLYGDGQTGQIVIRTYTKPTTAEALFKLIIEHEQWAYIVWYPVGWMIHPQTGGTNPENGELLFKTPNYHDGALWALDQINDRIEHVGHKFIHPQDGASTFPPENDGVVVHSDKHDRMKWRFVSHSSESLSKEVYPYGVPVMTGTWKIFHSVSNPTATQTLVQTIKIGQKHTVTTEMSFAFKWEGSGGVDIEIFSASVSITLQFMLDITTSLTWYTETTMSITMHVEIGVPVTRWQYEYEIEQGSHKSLFLSNVFGDTDSPNTEPSLQNAEYTLVG